VWRKAYADGQAAAQARRQPLILYFPSPRTGQDPPGILHWPAHIGRPAPLVGVQVSADEILALKERFRVTRLPALLFLDRREQVAARWEGSLPPEPAAAVLQAVRKLGRKEAEERRTLEEARRLEAAGDVGAAHRKAAPLWQGVTAAPEILAEARALEGRLLGIQRQALREALAAEGLVADDAILKSLEALRRRTPDASVLAELEGELRRLRTTSIAGRPAGK
jgi:hypothetical protein